MPVHLTCAQCGASFSRPPSLAAQVFCSSACWQAASWVERTCAECGTTFRARMSEIRKGGARYCSTACWYAGRPLVERFYEKVLCDVRTRCWFWTATTVFGYGQISRNARGDTARAHRIAWELEVGPIPPGMSVLHRCDVNWPPGDIGYRRCVNPEHLYLGDGKENNRWMAAAGRSTRGERNARARLTDADVIAIRDAGAAGATRKSLAERYGVSHSTISEVLSGKRWTHIAGQPGGAGTC